MGLDPAADKLGRLEQVGLRDVWAHEAQDFTLWMLENADVLSDVLGMQLELSAAEHKVGGFSLDLLGKDLASNDVVIIENQLEQTDHGHLGQLLTYAGGTDATNIIWCSPSFREEHRAALDWLNDRTDEDTRFFGIEVSAVRIDNSRPAPLFRLVAKPNDWAKKVHSQKPSSLTGKGAAYSEYWSELLQRIRTEHPSWTSSTGTSSQSWVTLPYGTSHIWFAILFTQSGPAVELYFGSSDAQTNTRSYEKYVRLQSELETRFGDTLVFEPLPDKKACRIRFYRPEGGDVLDTDHREELLSWFLQTMHRFRTAIFEVRQLIATSGA